MSCLGSFELGLHHTQRLSRGEDSLAILLWKLVLQICLLKDHSVWYRSARHDGS